MTEITDADRKAADDFAGQCYLSIIQHDALTQAFAAHRLQERDRVVAWLRKENALCDCHAWSENECACGAWQDYKTKPLLDLADALASGAHDQG